MGAKENREGSDLTRLWEQALNRYSETTGKDIRMLPRFTSVTDLLQDSEIKTNMFKKWRNPEDKMDKVRSTLGKTTDMLGNLVSIAGSAASGAFPPSEAIATAFNWILKASKDVSADYDKIMDFFDEMNTFLERLQIIEGKIPTVPAYQSHLMRVFSSMLEIAGIATVYIKKGRFRKWVKNFWQMGEDPELAGSYSTMEKELRRLESATGMVTYTNTEEIKTTTTDIKSDTTEIKSTTQELTKTATRIEATNKTIETTTQRLDSKTDKLVLGVTEIKDLFKNFEQSWKKNLQGQQKKAGSNPTSMETVDPSMKKYAAYYQVRKMFGVFSLDGDYYEKVVRETFVEGTCEWILKDQNYLDWIRKDGENPVMWIHGGTGVGKTNVSYSIVRDLKARLSEGSTGTSKSSVAYFFFRNTVRDLRNFCNAVCSAVLQLSHHDRHYCEQVLTDLTQYQQKVSYAGKFEMNPADLSHMERIWDMFFLSSARFKKDSDTHFYWVLDGLDDLLVQHRPTLYTLLKKLKEHKCNIHVLLTSSLALEKTISELEPITVEVTREAIATDMELVLQSRIRTKYTRIRKFRPAIKKHLANKILEKADSILYIEHMLRRLNLIGREGAALKDVEKNLPENLPAMYSMLLTEIKRRKAPEEYEAVKVLFGWLALSRRPQGITLEEANDILVLAGHDSTYGLEEEIQGKLGNIIEFSNDKLNNDDSEENGAFVSVQTLQRSNTLLMSPNGHDLNRSPTFDDQTTEVTTEKLLEDSDTQNVEIQFREPALKKFFMNIAIDNSELRLAPSTVHSVIFQICVKIVCGIYEEQGRTVCKSLKKYAGRYWMFHFQAIEHEDVAPGTAIATLEAIRIILSNYNNAAQVLEDSVKDDEDFKPVWAVWFYYGEDKEEEDEEGKKYLKHAFQEKMVVLAELALRMPEGKLRPELLEFCRSAVEAPGKLMSTLARAHTKNWLTMSFDPDDAEATSVPFWFAFGSLLLTDELGSWVTKADYMQSVSAKVILAMAHAFDGSLLQNAIARLGLAGRLRAHGYYKESLEQNKHAFEIAEAPFEKFLVYFVDARNRHISQYFPAYWSNLTDEEKKASTELAYDEYKKAFENRPQDLPDLTDEQRLLVRSAISAKATFEVDTEHIEEGLLGLEEARTLIPNSLPSPLIHVMIMNALSHLKRYSDIVDAYTKWNFWERLGWLTFAIDDREFDPCEIFTRAVRETSRTEIFHESMEEMIAYLDKQKSAAWLRLAYAHSLEFSLDNRTKAKELLYHILDHPDQCFDPRDKQEDLLILSQARSYLGQTLYFEFLDSSSPQRKLELLEEMKALQSKSAGTLEEIDAEESFTAVVLANMTRKMGPVVEFQKIMDATFQACINGLTDTEGFNDGSSLRLLGRVLATVGGLEREAMIAASAQFSITDPSVFNKDGDKAGGDDDKAEESSSGEADSNVEATAAEDKDESADGSEQDDNKESKDDSSVSNEYCGVEGCKDDECKAIPKVEGVSFDDEEDTNPTFYIYCDGECGSSIDTFNGETWYHCLVCMDTDLCHQCYRKRLHYTRTGKFTYWERYCGPNHKYIRSPIPGWRGIKDGIMTIGEEKINFKDWLEEVKDKKWPEAWDRFYRAEGGVESINL